MRPDGTLVREAQPQSYWPTAEPCILLPEIFSVGITCQLIDLLPAFPVIMLAAAFGWQSIVGFR